MTTRDSDQISEFANDIVVEYLDQGIEITSVAEYLDEFDIDVDEDDISDIHAKTRLILNQLSASL